MDYRAWNIALGSWFFNPARADETIYLSVDATTLLKAAQFAPTPVLFADRDAAVEDFRLAIQGQVRRGGWLLGTVIQNAYPGFLGLLGAQVLTVHQMHEGEGWTSAAYWPRLRLLLGEAAMSEMPTGLNGELHQALWSALENWSRSRTYQAGRWGRLDLTPGATRFRHIHVPKSHALLRLEDLQKLDGFFRITGLQKGESLPATYIERFVAPLRKDANLFSKHALGVLNDDGRFLPACEQIADFLQYGDYIRPLDKQARTQQQTRRLWLGIDRSDRLVGGLLLDADSYTPTHSQHTLDQLLMAFPGHNEWRPLRQSVCMAVYAPATEFHIERRVAIPGDRVLLLVPEAQVRSFELGLQQVATPMSTAIISYTSVSGGRHRTWKVLSFEVRDDVTAASLPPPWHDLVHIPQSRITLESGLQLRRGVWMAGAGPTVRVTGAKEASFVWLDDKRYEVVDGVLTREELDSEGVHSAWLPGDRRRPTMIVVRQVTAAPATKPLTWSRIKKAWPRNKPPGEDTDGWLCGPQVHGVWKPARKEVPVERLALALLTSIRAGVRLPIPELDKENLEDLEHPLLRALVAALPPNPGHVEGSTGH